MGITAPPITRARGGLRSATYRDSSGRSWDAVILSAGTNSGYKIRLTSRRGLGATAIVDDVALATSTHGVGLFTRDPGANYNQDPSTAGGDLLEGGYEDGYGGGY